MIHLRMVGKKEVIEEMEYSSSLKTIVQTYQEVAATRMQRIRDSVLASRDFLLGLNTIFQQVKMSYKIKSPEALAKGGKAQKTIHQTNGKTIFVFISANTGLYGNIIKRTFEVFINQFAKQKTADVAIVGRLGARLFQEKFPRKKFLFFSLSDNKIDHEGIKQILPYLIQYEKVIVFYEQFQNIISSTPIATSVSGDMLPWEKPESQDLKYIFEPSLKKVVEFFEKEIISVIFEQIVYESLLAKFSSRMVAMEEATDNIQTRLKQAILKKGRIKHQELNKKQNESLSSMSLWTTRL